VAYELEIPDGFAQVTLGFTGSALNFPAAVVFGVQHDGAVHTPTDVCTEIGAAWATTFDAQLYSGVVLSSVHTKFGPSEDGPAAETAPNNAGGKTGQAMTASACWLIRKNTTLGGKRGKGRMYLPGPTEDDNTLGTRWETAAVNAMQTAANAFMAALNTGNTPMVVLHRTREPGTIEPGDPGSPAPPPSPVQSLTVMGVPATQRRRLRR
jgi:hypothetical protein